MRETLHGPDRARGARPRIGVRGRPWRSRGSARPRGSPSVSNAWRRDGSLCRTDRGVQHACEPYSKALAAAGITPQVGRKGSCLDNASMESFSHSLRSPPPRRRGSSASTTASTPPGPRPGATCSRGSRASTTPIASTRRWDAVHRPPWRAWQPDRVHRTRAGSLAVLGLQPAAEVGPRPGASRRRRRGPARARSPPREPPPPAPRAAAAGAPSAGREARSTPRHRSAPPRSAAPAAPCRRAARPRPGSARRARARSRPSAPPPAPSFSRRASRLRRLRRQLAPDLECPPHAAPRIRWRQRTTPCGARKA